MRLIDADKIPYLHVDGFGVTSYAHRADIEKMPTIDPIRAAGGCRCGECKHYAPGTEIPCTSVDGLVEPDEDDFCSYGEPREVQDDE